MATNIQKLGSVLNKRMQKTAGAAVPTFLELGTINSNLSLTPDSLGVPIPVGDYLTVEAEGGSGVDTITHDDIDEIIDGTASGTVETNGNAYTAAGLQAGDRVLVAWCGNEPTVIGVVGQS